jgi:septin 7
MATGAAVVTHPEPELHHDSTSSSAKEELTAPALPSFKHGSSFNLTDAVDNSAAVANGNRASPAPNIPNGNAPSPYTDRGNPASQGASQTVSSKDPKAAAQAANDMRNVVRRKLTGYVGFANLPNQWHRKSVRKGFNFNVMVVGKQPLSLQFSTRVALTKSARR